MANVTVKRAGTVQISKASIEVHLFDFECDAKSATFGDVLLAVKDWVNTCLDDAITNANNQSVDKP